MTGLVGHGKNWGFIFNIPVVCITIIYLPDSLVVKIISNFLFLVIAGQNIWATTLSEKRNNTGTKYTTKFFFFYSNKNEQESKKVSQGLEIQRNK